MQKRFIPALLMLASFALAQEPEHLKLASLPQGAISEENKIQVQTAEADLLKLAEMGNRNNEYTYIFNQIKPMLTSAHQPISDDELLELRKAMSIQICTYGIFDYYFCNSRFIQGNPTAVFLKTQGSQPDNSFIFRGDDSTLYVVHTPNDGSGNPATTFYSDSEVIEVGTLYKLSNDLYVILRPSNGTCGEIFVLR